MIETIYSNDNGEDNKNKNTQALFKMPKNIRQVGKSNSSKKIYVEDYVMTFIKQLSGEDYAKCKAAVLVGQHIKIDNCRNIFISGAIEIEELDAAQEITFSNDIWTSIYEKIKMYFPEMEIVGWFLGGPGYLLEEEDRILKAHIDNFAGQDKTLLTYDNIEKEETFLIYENKRLTKQDGYYIYYEKNEEMQNYMIDHKKSPGEEVVYDDRVSREIRTVIQNKKSATEDTKNVSHLMYAAGTLLAVIILMVGAAMLHNYDQMRSMEATINTLTKSLQEVETVFNNNSTTPTSGLLKGNELSNKEKENSIEKENNKDSNIDSNNEKIEDNDGENYGDDSLDVEVVTGDVTPLPAGEVKNNTEKKSTETKLENQTPTKITPTSKPQPKETTAEVKYYTVQSGETLVGICFKLYNSANNLSVIKKLNNIENEDKIIAGQKLIVP